MLRELLIVYLTGLIVCIIYDVTLYRAGYNPWGDMKVIGKILDSLLWPITLIMALLLSLIFLKNPYAKSPGGFNQDGTPKEQEAW
jgi:hypothetical protein